MSSLGGGDATRLGGVLEEKVKSILLWFLDESLFWGEGGHLIFSKFIF